MTENYDPLVESGQMTLLRGDAEIVPGISVRVYPGHTRDMQAILVQSGGKTACYISDLIPTSAHLDLNWVMSYDLYPIETIESRKRYYAQALPEKWLTMFTHDAKLPWAYVVKDEKGKMVVGEYRDVPDVKSVRRNCKSLASACLWPLTEQTVGRSRAPFRDTRSRLRRPLSKSS